MRTDRLNIAFRGQLAVLIRWRELRCGPGNLPDSRRSPARSDACRASDFFRVPRKRKKGPYHCAGRCCDRVRGCERKRRVSDLESRSACGNTPLAKPLFPWPPHFDYLSHFASSLPDFTSRRHEEPRVGVLCECPQQTLNKKFSKFRPFERSTKVIKCKRLRTPGMVFVTGQRAVYKWGRPAFRHGSPLRPLLLQL